MRTSSKSFANSLGITQKPIATNPSMGIGLNPNLNIEDEYIENLLKQVHFLNMEIKLTKEKQKQNKGLGIMGLLNKDTSPVVTHAITSNDKFTDMKCKLQGLVNQSSSSKLRLQDENHAVKAQKDYLQKLNLKQQRKNIEHKLYAEKQLTQGVQKLRTNQNKLQELRTQADKTQQVYERLKRQFDDLKGKDKTKQLLNKINDNLGGQAEALGMKHFQLNNQKYKINNGKLQDADKVFKADPKYVELTQQSVQLKQKLKNTDRQLFDINYRVKQMQELKKMCIRNKDVEHQVKKQAGEQMERLKKKLIDKQGDMDSRLSESKSGLDTNDQVRLIKGKITRKDKQTNDIKRRTQISQTNYKKLRDEVQRLQEQLQLRKQENKNKQVEIAKKTVIMNQTDTVLRKTQLDYEKAESDLRNADGELRQTRKRLEQFQEQCAYLIAKQQFLNTSIDMDESIRQVKVEQLTNLMQSNLGLNTTITDLMGKWEQIIKFSRQPPGSV